MEAALRGGRLMRVKVNPQLTLDLLLLKPSLFGQLRL